MSDGDFQVQVEYRGGRKDVPVFFDEEELNSDYYLYMKLLEEEYYFEQMFEAL